jgi:hypothetical protein
MQTTQLTLRLDAFGAPPTEARVEIAVLSPAERLKRAGLGFGALLAVAVIALPIPVVHFVLVPGAMLGAIVLGAVRLRQGEVFRSVGGSCPLCGTEQMFAVTGRFKLPRKLYCAACNGELRLTT